MIRRFPLKWNIQKTAEGGKFACNLSGFFKSMKTDDFVIIFESVLLLHILVSMMENILKGTRHGIMKHLIDIIYFTLF